MTHERTIAFITGSRADYGVARWVLQDISDRSDLTLRLILTGSHLDSAFGGTIDEISSDGFTIDRKVVVDLREDSPVAGARWMADCLVGLTTALIDLAPDILVVVGDRFEALLAAQAAALAQVPIAHIHGGEVTQGSLDDGMRHAITKMAHVHFAAAPEYGRRIVQLGENPESVYVVGSPGLCAIDREDGVADSELADVLGFSPSEPFALATYHPATAGDAADSLAGLTAMIKALEKFPQLRVVLTGVNVDPGFLKHRELVTKFADNNSERVTLVESLGHRRYLAALRRARFCIGNSSSGIIEAPSLGTPSINIGIRQKGRLRAASVIDAKPDTDSVASAIQKALSVEFARDLFQDSLPYSSGGASQRIVQILAAVDIANVRSKAFHDCGAACDSWSALDGGASHG